jgi:hypothetical protein
VIKSYAMLKYLSLLVFVLLICNEVNATPGCVDAAQTRIYTNTHPSGYYRTNAFNTSNSGCYYYYSGAMCSIGSAGANNGYMGDTANVQLCPMDDYVWVILAVLGGFGYWTIRQRNLRIAV